MSSKSSADLLAHYRHVSQQLLTIVDVETTGHRATEGRVIEVSVLQATLADGILHQQTDLINPQMPVPETITAFTGISQDMVDQAPLATEVWHRYLPFLNQGVLTAHNLSFDYAFIRAESDRLGTSFERSRDQQFCTVILSRLMLPELPSRRLPDLVKHFGFDIHESHRAAADTLACWCLAKRLLTEIQNESDKALLQRFTNQWLPLGDVAALLGCSGREARGLLQRAGIKPRLIGRHKTPMYQRGKVEQLQPSQTVQLSWF
ncbi:3'-5' exonuclease [Pantanalinema sp. GBBB05]|uniref:3'-5' exonuclease n=1 Tax=Pantanalinema sp. GBBB05 TaxID=2604139 RepID=UPI001DD40E75|nr:3'-5' exonuclease [Pantanalinema sp. GBBB05]